jgi:arginyl-tRNA synthetase
MIREEIAKLIEKSIEELQGAKKLPEFNLPEIQIEHPEEKTHGDYATNVAMVVARQIKKSPMEIAYILDSKLKTQKLKLFEKIEVAKPGFIDFFISKEYLQKQVGKVLKEKEKFGQLNIGKGQKVNVEFISANPTGPLHLGHGRGAFFGDCLVYILEKAGYKVTREYYINDAKNSAQIKELGKTALGKGITYLTEYLKKKIQISKSKIQKCKNEGEAGYLLAQKVQEDIKKFIENKLKIKFDSWISEENLYRKSKVDKIYNWLKKKNLTYKKEKAEWLKTSNFGDKQDWVIIRETGEPTYLLSDIAYHKDKFDKKFGKIINILGADHQGHVGKIKAVAKMLDFRGDLDILISQVVRLKKGKISKRKGEIITLEWLIEEVGLDAARFIYLMKSLNTQMEFDVELAKERSTKSPVYYVQYAYARICSILRKISNKSQNPNLKLLKHPSEVVLIKALIKFPEIIADTSKDYQVQRLPQYAIDLATSFHQFYRDCKVLTKDKNLRTARLGLILAAQTVFKNTLGSMGVSAPEKM